MEWLPTPKQTDWIPPDLSAHYISSAALFFSFFYFCTDANRKAPFEEGDNCAWVECSVWSAEPQFSFFCFAGSFPFSRCQRGPLERSVGAQTCRRKRVGKGRLRRGGGGNRATATPLSLAWNLSGTLLSPSGEWEWKQSELRLIQSDRSVKCATLLSLMHSLHLLKQDGGNCEQPLGCEREPGGMRRLRRRGSSLCCRYPIYCCSDSFIRQPQ